MNRKLRFTRMQIDPEFIGLQGYGKSEVRSQKRETNENKILVSIRIPAKGQRLYPFSK